MNRVVALASVGIAAILGGCASLEQAQLVYVSTNQIGLITSGGKAESPTPSLIIGYSGVDVAIVPVAVAKKCGKDALAAVPDDSKSPNCKNIDPSINRIEGNHKNSISISDKGKIDQLDSEINILNKEIDGYAPLLDGSITQLNNYKLQKDVTEKNIQDIGTALSGMKDTDDKDSQKAEKLNQKKTYEEEKSKLDSNINTVNSRIESYKNERNNKRQEIATKQIALDALRGATNNTSGDEKTDALSVYGTFDGSAKNNPKDTTGLNVGKTFSTGIAAQNITQGLRDGGKQIATAKCFGAALELLNAVAGAKTQAAIDTAIHGCSDQPIPK